MTMRVLVAEGSGFIGRRAVFRLIHDGWGAHVVAQNNPSIEGANFYHVDISAQVGVQGVIQRAEATYLRHFAWDTTPSKYWNSATNLDWVAGSLHLVQLFAEYGGERAVLAGTCAEYSWRYHTMKERVSLIEPATPHGQAKASLFELLDRFTPQMNLPFAWGRIFFPVGLGEKRGRMLPK